MLWHLHRGNASVIGEMITAIVVSGGHQRRGASRHRHVVGRRLRTIVGNAAEMRGGTQSVTSVDPLPLNQSEVMGTSGIVDDSAQEDTASVVDLSKCYRLGQMKFIYTY